MILYAGNYLSKHGLNPTFIESLTPKLQEFYDIKSVSDKKNKIIRLFDMLYNLLSHKNEIKLVLIDSYCGQAFWYTYIIARICVLFKIPYVPILHSGTYPDRLRQSPEFSRFIFSNAAKIISPSLYLKKHFDGAGFNAEYIPNFIQIENYQYKQRENVKTKLLWVRAFEDTYNPVLAIEILFKLRSKFPDTELCMVGPDLDGTLSKVIERANELGVNDSLKLTGRLGRKEWIELSKDYDIFINTTDFDNHPISVIEAMALGLPVVSTNAGGLPFLIESCEDGILLNKNDSDGFVNAIEKIISDNELLLKITANARKKVEGFDWAVIRQKWFDVIDPLAGVHK
ncbi:MAG: glycosyltransferase family 4 protein [Ignavibacteria bacterium]|nr:glycosyltransferase family 4 protein [Ignavibacteria bacterium]